MKNDKLRVAVIDSISAVVVCVESNRTGRTMNVAKY